MIGSRSLAALSAALLLASAPTRAAEPLLTLERTIPLPGVKGRIDHLAVDLKRHRLYVAALGSGTVEAVDLDGGRVFRRIEGLKEPQGLAYLPGPDQLAAASGEDGTVRFYEGESLKPAGVLTVGGDADNLRVARTGMLVVGHGGGALSVIDPRTRAVVASVKLPAHPEGFQLDGTRALVNLPGAGRIAAVDLAAGRVAGEWKAAHGFNFPLALDAAGGRFASVYRLPARLVVMEAASGKTQADLATCGDADDAFFDPLRGRLYVICGAGQIDVVHAAPGATPASLGRIATRAGARTGLFAPDLDRLYVAARAGAGGEAAILVFRPS